MIKIVRVPLKKNEKSDDDQKITAQYRYIKELALLKYDAEEKREQNLIQQSSQMQTAFSFMTAAIFYGTPYLYGIPWCFKPEVLSCVNFYH